MAVSARTCGAKIAATTVSAASRRATIRSMPGCGMRHNLRRWMFDHGGWLIVQHSTFKPSAGDLLREPSLVKKRYILPGARRPGTSCTTPSTKTGNESRSTAAGKAKASASYEVLSRVPGADTGVLQEIVRGRVRTGRAHRSSLWKAKNLLVCLVLARSASSLPRAGYRLIL